MFAGRSVPATRSTRSSVSRSRPWTTWVTSPVIFIEKYAHKRALTPEYGWFSSRYQVTGYIPESSRRQVRYSTSLSIRTFSVIFFFHFLKLVTGGCTLVTVVHCIFIYFASSTLFCLIVDTASHARAHTHTHGGCISSSSPPSSPPSNHFFRVYSLKTPNLKWRRAEPTKRKSQRRQF